MNHVHVAEYGLGLSRFAIKLGNCMFDVTKIHMIPDTWNIVLLPVLYSRPICNRMILYKPLVKDSSNFLLEHDLFYKCHRL